MVRNPTMKACHPERSEGSWCFARAFVARGTTMYRLRAFDCVTRKDEMPTKNPHDNSLREHLLDLLNGGGAHTRFDAVVKDMPEKLRGVIPAGLSHSAWMLLDHLRLAQWDILEFSRN